MRLPYDAAMTRELHVVESDADYERFLAIRNAVDPRPLTLAGYRAERTAALATLDLLATVDGRDVGAGMAGWGSISADAGVTYLDVWVIPDARRQGVGGALLDRLVAFARQHGLERAHAAVVDGDAASLDFAVRRGLAVEGAGQLGHLTITSAHAGDLPTMPDGLEIVSLGDRRDLERDVYDLEMAVKPEVPAMADEPDPPFASWQADLSGDPGFLPALSLLALVDGRLAGAIHVYDNADDAVFIGMTAVHPRARRRGIARLLKTELARRAAAAGIRRIETYNDGTNERIRALNESLGYEYQPRLLLLKGPLPPERSAGSAAPPGR